MPANLREQKACVSVLLRYQNGIDVVIEYKNLRRNLDNTREFYYNSELIKVLRESNKIQIH